MSIGAVLAAFAGFGRDVTGHGGALILVDGADANLYLANIPTAAENDS